MKQRRIPAVLSLVASLALVAACGSGAATTPTATPAGASIAPGASVDVGDATSGLSKLSAYKVTLHVAGSSAANVEVVVVNGTVPAKSVRTTTGSTTIRVLEIGDDVWVDAGNGTYLKNVMTKAQADAMIGAFDPGVFMASLTKAGDLGVLRNVGSETKNGVNATHLHADDTTTLPAGSSPIPAGATADLWIASDGGYLVALEAVGFSASGSQDVSIEVTNINDPSLKVEAPA